MAAAEMHEITEDPDIRWKYVDFDVYFRSDGHYGLYKKKGVTFDAARLKCRKLPEHLFISLSDRIGLIRNQTRRLNETLAKRLKEDPVKAKNCLSEVVAVTLSEPRSQTLEDIKDTIDIVVDEYLNSPEVIRNLIQVSMKDFTTHLHLTNVMLFCLGFAHHAGYGEADLRLFGLGGLLHDVGKVDIPDEILTAPRRLTDEEFELIKQHTRRGWEMLKACNFDKKIATCALEHHERLDGSGYPRRKAAGELCAFSRALSIADVYEALTTWRPYKEPMPPLAALKIMKDEVDQQKLDGLLFKEFAQSIVRMTN